MATGKDLSVQRNTERMKRIGPSDALRDMSIANSTAGANTSGYDSLKDMSVALAPKPETPTRMPRTPAAPAVPQPKTAAGFEADLTRSAQREINSLNKYAMQQLEALKPRAEERLQENASVNTLTGLAGSTEANRTTEATTAVNKKEQDLVRAETAAKVQQVLSGVKSKALELAQQERENFRLDTKAAEEARVTRLTEATNNATLLAQSGVTADGLRNSDPDSYQALAEQVGGEEYLKAMFTLNRPQEQILDKKIEGGKYVIAYQNPIDGKVRIESVDLGLPVGYSKTVDAGNRILAIPDDWDGDPSKLVTINKGLTPGQAAGAGSGSSGGGIYEMLDFRTANAVISQADKFNSSDVVKRLNATQQAFNAVQSIDPNTQNPADHQALIYDFAKALDPESVVREGEYETIKKYSQNIISKFGGEINNTINGTGFLSADAIANIKTTIANRYDSQVKQYRNKATETARTIDTIAGKPVANMVLQDYESGAVSQESGEPQQMQLPDGTIVTLQPDGTYQ